jgi:hypothetical protein
MIQMTAPWLAFVLALSFVAVGSQRVSGQPSPPSIYQRPTVVNARIGGSPRLRDGTYNATGVSGVCGLIPKEASLTGEAMFVVEFPSDAASGSITSIAFGSNQLVPGNAKAAAFRLSVGVVTSAGGRPPLYVLNTDAPQSKSSGTATLVTTGRETTLTVKGQDDLDETIELTVVCS